MYSFNRISHYILCVGLLSLFSHSSFAGEASSNMICADGRDFNIRRLDSKVTDKFCEAYAGKTLLIVNTASRCVYTDQYSGLESLYQKYKDKGLVVIGFPSNNFNAQEPGTESSIKSFCRLTYDVNFPMYAKSEVIGEKASTLYKALTQLSGEAPSWNFHKYLIDKKGMVESIPSYAEPGDLKLINAIESAL